MEIEQRAIEGMYAHLEGEEGRIISAREATTASPVGGIEAREARDATSARLNSALERLRSAERSLCFGRIDGTDGQSWHIGRIGLRTESGDILLVDWRAEAARPFYAATMASPMGGSGSARTCETSRCVHPIERCDRRRLGRACCFVMCGR